MISSQDTSSIHFQTLLACHFHKDYESNHMGSYDSQYSSKSSPSSFELLRITPSHLHNPFVLWELGELPMHVSFTTKLKQPQSNNL